MQLLPIKSIQPLKKPGTRVCISWDSDWNEPCAWAIEQFGFPETRYTITLRNDNLDFIFEDEADAIHFSLRWL